MPNTELATIHSLIKTIDNAIGNLNERVKKLESKEQTAEPKVAKAKEVGVVETTNTTPAKTNKTVN